MLTKKRIYGKKKEGKNKRKVLKVEDTEGERKI